MEIIVHILTFNDLKEKRMKRLYFQIVDADTTEIVRVCKTRMFLDNETPMYPNEQELQNIVSRYVTTKGRQFYLEHLSRDEFLEETGLYGYDVIYKPTGKKIYEGTIRVKGSNRYLQTVLCRFFAPSSKCFLKNYVKEQSIDVRDLRVQLYEPTIKAVSAEVCEYDEPFDEPFEEANEKQKECVDFETVDLSKVNGVRLLFPQGSLYIAFSKDGNIHLEAKSLHFSS